MLAEFNGLTTALQIPLLNEYDIQIRDFSDSFI